MKAHVTKEENKRFKKMGYTSIERQIQYARAILKRKPKVDVNYLINATLWKFGYSIIDRQIYKELKG